MPQLSDSAVCSNKIMLLVLHCGAAEQMSACGYLV